MLDLANPVRPSAPGLDLTLTGDRGPGPAPLLVRCHDEATQAREICARILEATQDGTALRDQAVLVRTGHHSDILEIELSARKIPYLKFGGLKFTDTAHVRDFLAAARILANPADELAWFRLLRLHDGIGPGHARRVLAIVSPGTDLEPGQCRRRRRPRPPGPGRALTATLDQLAAAAGAAGPAQAEALVSILDPLVRARYPDAEARLADLRRVADAAAAQPSLHDALAELTLDPPVSGSDLAGPPRLDEDYLTISTIHAAKGLEWPVVHVPHLVDGALPSDMALGRPGRAGRRTPPVLRRPHPGPRPAVPVRAAAAAPPPPRPRRPARLRPAHPLPAPRRAGRLRQRRRGRARSGPARDRPDQRPGGRRARLTVGRLRAAVRLTGRG